MTTRLPIPKERLEQILAHCKRETPENMAPISARSAVEIIGALLAAHEQEPVAWQYRVSAGQATGWSLWHEGKGEQYEKSYQVERRPLYTHPAPVPAVPDDTRRMDWLVSKTVNVRQPMVYGSHDLFWSQTISDDWEEEHKTTLREQIDAAMAAAPKAPDGWIPVSERMPPCETGVLVATEMDGPGDWRMKWATYVPEHPDAINGWFIPGASWTPTHWQPLPEPPKVKP